MRYFVYIITLLSALSCSPKLAEPTVVIPESYSYGESIILESDSTRVWWRNYADPTLQLLIEQALASNRSLAATMADVNAARHNLRVARSSYLPNLSLDVDAERYREVKVYESEYSVTPTISWQIPLFGAYRSTKESARSQALSTEWEARGSALTLASEVATTYYTLLKYRATLEVSQRSYQLRSQATALIDSMYRHGMSSRVDLEQAQALVLSAYSEMESNRESLRLSELSLSLLLSTTIEECNFELITTTLQQLTTPENVPCGIPSDLLYSRPDIRESFYKMSQAMSAVGVARSAQFPSLSLTVDGGLFSTTLSGLSLSKLLTWEWAIDLAQPIFNFAALKSRRKMAVAEYEAALLRYEQTILSALKDVEAALVTIAATREMSQSAHLYMDNYSRIARSTAALYRGGMESYLNVVDAEREYYTSQIDYLEMVAGQQINYVNLFTSLGCSW